GGQRGLDPGTFAQRREAGQRLAITAGDAGLPALAHQCAEAAGRAAARWPVKSCQVRSVPSAVLSWKSSAVLRATGLLGGARTDSVCCAGGGSDWPAMGVSRPLGTPSPFSCGHGGLSATVSPRKWLGRFCSRTEASSSAGPAVCL